MATSNFSNAKNCFATNYQFSYDNIYEPIYDAGYDTGFVFYDEDEEELDDYAIDYEDDFFVIS